LRQLADTKGKDAHLFPVRPALRIRPGGRISEKATRGTFDNPPNGAIIHYYLKARPKDDITLTVLDAKGGIVRTLTSKKEPKEKEDEGSYSPDNYKQTVLPREAGLHRVVWDLRYEGAKYIRGARVDSGQPRTGPLVVPGTYALQLKVNGKTLTGKVEVKLDPRQKITESEVAAKDRRGGLKPRELEEQLKLTLQLRDDISRLSGAANDLRSIRKQLTAREELLKDNKTAKPLLDAGKALMKQLDALENAMHNPKAKVSYDILAQKGGAKLYSQLVWLYEQLKDSDGAPAQGLREVYGEQRGLLKKYLSRWKGFVAKSLPDLNKQARKLDLPGLVIPKSP